MIISGSQKASAAGKRGSRFTGVAHSYLTIPTTEGVTVNTVVFTPGARTYWHSHENGQILQVIAGRGRIRSAGGQLHTIRAGDTVWVSPGERHWHGADPESLMAHTAISLGKTVWQEEVSAEEFGLSTREEIPEMSDEQGERSVAAAGVKVRREVLGSAHVDASLNHVSEFSRPMQELVNEYCWGNVWSRDGLPRKTRSLITLTILTVLNRSHELEVHLRGALNNGASEAEIQETLLHTAVYAGVPAALESFRIAERVLSESARHD